MDALRRQIIAGMPFFQMQAMVDTLYRYAHPGPELTQDYGGRIRPMSGPSLCLDVQWGNPNAGTPVWLWPCTGDPAQHWSYDRQSQTIRQVSYGKCLDVRGGGSTPGTAVEIWDCNGGDAQRWSYDPEKHELRNAGGLVLLVLDVQWANLAAQTPLWVWPRNDTAAQLYLAE